MYSQYNKNKTKYLGQVISIVNNKYNVYFMDGDQRDGVSEKEMRKPKKKQLEDRFVGRKFCDQGDSQFEKGEFEVLIRDGEGYWCERDTFGDTLQEKRDIQLYEFSEVEKLTEKYEKE